MASQLLKKSVDSSRGTGNYYGRASLSVSKFNRDLKYQTKRNDKYFVHSRYSKKLSQTYIQGAKQEAQFEQNAFLFKNKVISMKMLSQQKPFLRSKKQKYYQKTQNMKILLQKDGLKKQIQQNCTKGLLMKNQIHQTSKLYHKQIKKFHGKSLFESKKQDNCYIGLSKLKNKPTCIHQDKGQSFQKYRHILQKFSVNQIHILSKEQSLKCISFSPKRRNSVNLNPPSILEKYRIEHSQANLDKKNEQTEYLQSFITEGGLCQQAKPEKRSILKKRCKTINSERAMINYIQI